MNRTITTALTLTALTLTGCSTTQTTKKITFPIAATPGYDDGFDATALTIHKGDLSGTATFDEMIDDLADADVIIVGEMHNHKKALDFIATTYQSLIERNDKLVLSMEFYERDLQGALDDYLSGVTDYPKFVKAANRNKGNNPIDHLRMIELSKEHNRQVIAANSPRRYTTMARKQGFEALEKLTDLQKTFFTIPEKLPEGYYADTFRNLMSGMAGHNDNDDIVNSFLRSQSVWDQTMAASISNAVLNHNAAVYHVVGYFHADNNLKEGGSPMTDAIRARLGDHIKIRSIVTHGPESNSITSHDAPNEEKSVSANYILYLPME